MGSLNHDSIPTGPKPTTASRAGSNGEDAGVRSIGGLLGVHTRTPSKHAGQPFARHQTGA